jgi:sugar phosphate isomerase/epimerase
MPMNAGKPEGMANNFTESHVLIGIDHLTLLYVSPPELVSIASAAGFDAVGIRVHSAGPDEEPWPITSGSSMLEETLQRLRSTGIQVLDVEVLRLGPEIKRQDYEALLEIGGLLGARFLNVMGDDTDLHRLADNFAQLTADAHPYGLRPLIEPMTYQPVHSLELAACIAARSNGGGILVDSLHFQRCGQTLDQLRSLDPALLPVMQLCDAPLNAPARLSQPRQLPRGMRTDMPVSLLESRAMRLLPGYGELPLPELLAALPAGTPISVEAPVFSLWETMPAGDIARLAHQAALHIIDKKAAWIQQRSRFHHS